MKNNQSIVLRWPHALNLLSCIVGIALYQFSLTTSASAAASPFVVRFDGGFRDTANGITTDALGNAYVAGSVEGTSRQSEFTVLKYDSSGALQWQATYANATHAVASGSVNAIAVDAAGNVYAVGSVYTQVTPFIVNLDWLVVSYSPSGMERWSHRINGTANMWDIAGAVLVDGSNVYVSGSVDDTVSSGKNGWTLIKYSSDGVVQWRHTDLRTDGRYDSFGHLHRDAAGNIIGAGLNLPVQFNSQNKIVTTKVSANGDVLWRQVFSDTPASDDLLMDMDIDNVGNVFITGETVASTDPELEHTPITLKYDANGSLQYILRGDGAGGTSLAVDNFGDVVVSGTSLRGGGNPGVMATSKYDTAGNRIWSTVGVAGDVGVDQAGNVYVYSSPPIFKPNNSADLVTVKLSSNGLVAWQHIVDAALSATQTNRDTAIGLSVDPFGNVFEVANSETGTKDDVLMLRYAANTTPQQPPASIAAPSGLVASATSGRVTLRWVDNSSDESAFSIERCQGKSCTNFTALATVTSNVVTYVDAGLARSTTYQYRVKAINGAVSSAYSNVATATTPKK